MTENHSSTHAVRAEEDRISTGTIVAVGVGSLLVFFLASAVAVRTLHARQAELLPDGPAPLPAEVGKAKIGMVEQQLFEATETATLWRDAQRQHLSSYGWVDRKGGFIRIPIDRAMDLAARGERP